MKLKHKFKILFIFVFVSIYMIFKNDVQAMTQEEAGQYIAQFAINFFDNYADQTIYSQDNELRSQTYYGRKTSGETGGRNSRSYTDKYAMDCVAWISFVIYQSLGFEGGTPYGGFKIYAQPGHGNRAGAQYYSGFSQIYGRKDSGEKIPLEELRNVLKPR